MSDLSDLSDLYQEVILDHSKTPRNFRAQEDPTRVQQGHNPLCGDRLTVYLKLDGDTVTDVSFEGSGCAISKASASMMTQAVKGRTVAEAQELFRKFHEMVTGEPGTPVDDALGKLAVFSGVCEFPVRVKCASLSWHTLQGALETSTDIASTE